MPDIGGLDNLIQTFLKEGMESVQEVRREAQEATEDAHLNLLMNAGEFSKKLQKGSKPLNKHLPSKVGRKVKPGDKEEALSKEQREKLDKGAKEFSDKVSGLDSKSLASIREKIQGESEPEEVLKEIDKVEKYANDPFLRDQVLEFLIETTEGELKSVCEQARSANFAENSRVIRQRRRLPKKSEKDRKFSETYGEIVHEPTDWKNIYDSLKKRYKTSELSSVCYNLLKCVAQENKEGPTIEKGKLHDIFEEIKHLQAITGVNKFFDSRMDLVYKMYAREGLSVPQHLTPELLFEEFLTMVSDRYFSADRAGQIGHRIMMGTAARAA